MGISATITGVMAYEMLQEGNTGECDDNCPNDSSSDSSDNAPESDNEKQTEKGDRWTSDQDAEEQYQGIEREQRRRRKKGDNVSIHSTRKSASFIVLPILET